MEKIISSGEIEEFKKIKGEVKGVSLKENFDFIFKEEGASGLRKLEDSLSTVGFSLKYQDIKAMTFYPLWLDAILLTAIERLFNYDAEKFREMGRFEPKTSFIIRIFIKYFVSLERAAREVPRMWRQTFTVGDLRVKEFDEKEGRGTIILENYKFLPVQCTILQGYFSSVVQMIVGKEVSCQEVKCVFKGDPHHEFLFKWD